MRWLIVSLIARTRASNQPSTPASHNPFAELKDLLGKKG
jgi:hypothetical protein